MRNEAKSHVPLDSAAVDSASPTSTYTGNGLGARLQNDLRARWQRGERTFVETYFEREPALTRDEEAALDLVFLEFVLRSEHGESPTTEEYVRRFPQYATRLHFLLTFDKALCDFIDVSTATQSSDANDAPASATPQVELKAEVIAGKYRVIEMLDKGGQGAVYRALHLTLGRDVVLKLSHRPCPDDSSARRAFLEEGRILATLKHPHIAAVHDLDFHAGRAFLAIEYIRGLTLEQFARQKPQTPADAARLTAKVARALAAAHRCGVTHRDLKPKNILINADGEPCVIDFGLAHLHRAWGPEPQETGHVSGTLPFMPPEQARGEMHATDARTDVFALGGVLYFLLTGKALYTGKTFDELIVKARTCAFDRAALRTNAIPPRIRTVCLKALAGNPDDRYQSAEQMADELDAAIRPRRWKRTLGLAAGALAGIALAVSLYFALPTPEAKDVGSLADDRTPTLSIDVLQKGEPQPRPLSQVREPRTGDEFKVVAPVRNKGYAASLFMFDSRGKLTKLASRPAGSMAPLVYPQGENRGAELDGQTGTEFVFVVARRDNGPIEADEVRTLLQLDAPLPRLPPDSYLLLLRGKVEIEPEMPRGVKGEKERQEWAAHGRLEKMLQALQSRFNFFEGIAFTHKD